MTLQAFVVDLDRLRTACGAGDMRLLDEARQRFPHAFESESERIDENDGEQSLSMDESLVRLLQGRTAGDEYGDDLAAALAILCGVIGERLPGDMYDEARASFLSQVGWIEPLLKTGPPIPLPPLLEIEVGTLTAADSAAERQRLSALDRSHHEQGVVEARNELLDWLEEAERTGLGLLLFCE